MLFRPDPTFISKVNTCFHRAWEIVLPSCCPNPQRAWEHECHSLSVLRALRCYMEGTKPLRKTDALFILFKGPSMGNQASKSMIARWLKKAIVRAYEVSGISPTEGITAHSIRGWQPSRASAALRISKTATWASPSTFTCHYKIDQAASAVAIFDR